MCRICCGMILTGLISVVPFSRAGEGDDRGDAPFRDKIVLFGAKRVAKPNTVAILKMNPDGTRVEVVLDLEKPGTPFGRISPDGRRLAFGTEFGTGEVLVSILEADGHVHEIPGEGFVSAWSPDGRSLACHRRDEKGERWQNAIIDTGTGVVRALDSLNPDDAIVDWSPGGGRIAIMVANRDRGLLSRWKGEAGPFRQIDLADPDGSHRVRITPGSGDCIWPRFSPDGSRIAYYQRQMIGEKSFKSIVIRHLEGEPRIVAIRSDRLDAELRETAEAPAFPSYWGPHGEPCWSPDGKRIAVVLDNFKWRSSNPGAPDRFALAFATPDGRIERTIDLETIGISWVTRIDWK